MPDPAARVPRAVLTVSAWRHGEAVVARVTYAVEVARSEDVVVTVSSAEAVLDVVRSWLGEIQSAAPDR